MKLIIFDIDGTLANTKTIDDTCFLQALLQSFQIDWSKHAWESLQNVTDWGITEEIYTNAFQRTPTSKDYQRMHDQHIGLLKKAHTQQAFQAIPNAVNFFNQIKDESNFGIAIATGAWGASARIKLGAIGIDSSNIPFANSDHFKTREGITQYAIEQARKQYQTDFEEIIYFGDGAWDYKTCKNLGIRFIGIDILNDGKLRKLGAETVFRDFSNPDAILATLGVDSRVEKE